MKCSRVLEGLSGLQRSSEVFRGLQRSSEVFRGLQRSSEVFRGLQRSSEVPRNVWVCALCLAMFNHEHIIPVCEMSMVTIAHTR